MLILNGDIVSEDLPCSATASALKPLGESTAEGSGEAAADWLRISQSQRSKLRPDFHSSHRIRQKIQESMKLTAA